MGGRGTGICFRRLNDNVSFRTWPEVNPVKIIIARSVDDKGGIAVWDICDDYAYRRSNNGIIKPYPRVKAPPGMIVIIIGTIKIMRSSPGKGV